MTAENQQVRTLYTLWTTDEQNNDQRQRCQVMAFLDAHGIEPGAIIVGNTIDVVRTADGELRMRTWRIPREDMSSGKECPHCPGCVKQEPIEVPLAAYPPLDVAPAHRFPGFDESMTEAGFAE